jgi:hypothetical protein
VHGVSTRKVDDLVATPTPTMTSWRSQPTHPRRRHLPQRRRRAASRQRRRRRNTRRMARRRTPLPRRAHHGATRTGAAARHEGGHACQTRVLTTSRPERRRSRAQGVAPREGTRPGGAGRWALMDVIAEVQRRGWQLEQTYRGSIRVPLGRRRSARSDRFVTHVRRSDRLQRLGLCNPRTGRCTGWVKPPGPRRSGPGVCAGARAPRC